MRYKNREELKERAISLYIAGKSYVEISKIIGCSRNYVSSLIKNDERIRSFHNQKILKVYKNPNNSKKNLTIGIDLLSKIGVSNECDFADYVNVFLDESNNQLIIKKCEI